MTATPLRQLIETYAMPGAVRWLGVRPERRVEVRARQELEISADGIVGDHRRKPGKRAVSLVQCEHMPVIASLLGERAPATDLLPALLRRNIAVAHINLLGLRNREFRIGSAILRGTGVCAPCSRMEEALGQGGYAAVRGHGGITADIVEPGHIALGDPVEPLSFAKT